MICLSFQFSEAFVYTNIMYIVKYISLISIQINFHIQIIYTSHICLSVMKEGRSILFFFGKGCRLIFKYVNMKRKSSTQKCSLHNMLQRMSFRFLFCSLRLVYSVISIITSLSGMMSSLIVPFFKFFSGLIYIFIFSRNFKITLSSPGNSTAILIQITIHLQVDLKENGQLYNLGYSCPRTQYISSLIHTLFYVSQSHFSHKVSPNVL